MSASSFSRLSLGAALLLGASVASAQVTPGGLPTGPGGPSGQPDRKDGVAEAAPKAAGQLPTTPVLPAPRNKRKRWRLLEVDGYYRLRTDWFKNFNLGFRDDPAGGGAPFPQALSCHTDPQVSACDDTLSGSNMRLRLEPTINVDEGTSVHLQLDVYDNLVLGSTPLGEQPGTYSDTNRPPLGAFGDSQGPVVRGSNSDRDPIVVKRAWAEVALPLGLLKFGRMPNHWGLGIMNNAGGEDPVHGTYDYDADYGDTVDRVSFSAIIPGTRLRGQVASDWSLTRLTSNQTAAGAGREGHPFDLDDGDDANQWVFTISQMDSPTEFRDILDRGELAFNYGLYLAYKTQSWDVDLRDFQPGGTLGGTRYVPRDLTSYTPDVWGRIGYGGHLLEVEAALEFGSIGRLDDQGLTGSVDLAKFGGVGRYSWTGLEDKFTVGLEVGGASGDSYDNNPQGNTHISNANLFGKSGDSTLSQFIFDRNYQVDLILFRHLLGAVTNATYFKPFLSYQLTNSITFRASNVNSFAVRKSATPGNELMYGVEMDSEISYQSGGFYAGLTYGVLFPLAAMAHPADDPDSTNPEFGYAMNNQGDPGNAHNIQARVVLSF
ncbi:MAG: TIGR04551 family protein [Kofleriaceae bacterium]